MPKAFLWTLRPVQHSSEAHIKLWAWDSDGVILRKSNASSRNKWLYPIVVTKLKSPVVTTLKQLVVLGLVKVVSIAAISARNRVMSRMILTTRPIFARKLAVGIKRIVNLITSVARNVTKTVIYVPSKWNANYRVVILNWLNVVWMTKKSNAGNFRRNNIFINWCFQFLVLIFIGKWSTKPLTSVCIRFVLNVLPLQIASCVNNRAKRLWVVVTSVKRNAWKYVPLQIAKNWFKLPF